MIDSVFAVAMDDSRAVHPTNRAVADCWETNPASFDEAELEAANDGAHHGVVWAHRRGYASPAKGYVVMSGETYARLLTAAGFGGAA